MIQYIALKYNLSRGKGFTLIELLVVIAIIGLLASIVVVSLGGARRGSRDVRAAADLRQIQTALEFSYNSLNTYPVAIPATWTNMTDLADLHEFLNPVPITNGVATYEWCDNGSPADTYRLRVDLEDDKVGSLIGDCYYITNTGVTAGTCTATSGCTLP